MTIQDFVAQHNNQALDFDHQYGPQCMDLIQFWAQALGKRIFTGNAVNVPGQNHDQWNWVNNSPSAVPTPGSIMCYAPNNKAVGTGPFAHVDIFISGDVHSFNAFDQNWGGVQRSVQVHHNSYAGVMGWLAPIGATPPPASVGGTATCVRTTNVRTAPSTTAVVTSVLQPGNTFSYTQKVTGQLVNQNGVSTDQWYHSTLGHYVWAGNCTG